MPSSPRLLILPACRVWRCRPDSAAMACRLVCTLSVRLERTLNCWPWDCNTKRHGRGPRGGQRFEEYRIARNRRLIVPPLADVTTNTERSGKCDRSVAADRTVATEMDEVFHTCKR